MKYVALLRGINVGGNTMLKMETLRATFASLGFENVKSYINSGNVIFETPTTGDAELADKIRGSIKTDFDMDIPVLVRSISEIGKLIADNPFAGKFENDKDLHVFFLAKPLSLEQTGGLLLANESDNEKFAIHGREIYYLLRISIVDSVLGKGFIDKTLKVAATARNWRTVKKILELCPN